MSVLTAGQWRIDQNPNNTNLLNAISKIRTNAQNIPSNIPVINGYTVEQTLTEFFLDNPDVSNEQLIQISQTKQEDIPRDPKISDSASKPGNKFAVELMHALTGIDKGWLRENLSGLAFTGPASLGESWVIYVDNDDNILFGTILHDITDYLQKAGVTALNYALWGTANSILSALVMFFDALYGGVGENSPLVQSIPYSTELLGSRLGGQIASLYADDEFASQLIAQSLGEVVGGYVGQSIDNYFDLVDSLNGAEESISLGTLHKNITGAFAQNAIALGSAQLAAVIIEDLDVNNAITQIGLNALATSIASHYTAEFVIEQFGTDFAVNYLGFSDETVKAITGSSDLANIGTNFVNAGASALGSYIGSQLHQKMIEQWNILSEDYSVEGAAIGGTIGGIIGSIVIPIPGVGAAIGSLVGGIIGGTFGDKDYPRAGFMISVIDGAFVSQFSYDLDGGNASVASQMANSARDILNYFATNIGGKLLRTELIAYGHQVSEYIYYPSSRAPGYFGGSSGRGRVGFGNPQDAIIQGAIYQLTTTQIEGGDLYLKRLLKNIELHGNTRPVSINTIEKLNADFQVAREYAIYKDNPAMYEQFIQHLDDNAIQEADARIIQLRSVSEDEFQPPEDVDGSVINFGLQTLPSEVTVSRDGNNFVVNGKVVTKDEVIRFADGSRFKPVVNEDGSLTLEDERVVNWINIKARAEELNLDLPQPSDTYAGADASKIIRYEGNALVFDGNDYVNMGDSDDLVLTDNFTLEAWINPAKQGGSNGGIIINKEGEYEIARFPDGTIRWYLWTESAIPDWVNTGYVAPENKWTHIALSYDKNAVKVYADGNLVHYYPTFGNLVDGDTNSNDFRIGGRQNSSQYFQGQIGEVRVWNKARSHAEILINMESQLTGDETGLVGYWKIEEGKDNTVYDLTGNNNNGTIHGATWRITQGGIGDDVLIAADNNQPLAGDKGNDIYIYSRGMGEITINDTEGLDVIELDSSIQLSDILIVPVDDDLVIGIKDSDNPESTIAALSDKVIITNYQTNEVELIRFGNNQEYLVDDLLAASEKLTVHKALKFDGVDDYLHIENFNGFPSTEITLEGWFKKQNKNKYKPLFSYAIPGQDNHLLIEVLENTQILRFYIHDGNYIDTTFKLTEEDWQHLAFTWRSSDGNLKIYQNGIEVFSGTFAKGKSLTSGGSLVFGQEQDSVGGRFDANQTYRGQIDEVRIWNKIRTQEEIQADMNHRLTGEEVDLIAYWNFDQTSGEIATDSSGNNNHGTVNGTTWITTGENRQEILEEKADKYFLDDSLIVENEQVDIGNDLLSTSNSGLILDDEIFQGGAGNDTYVYDLSETSIDKLPDELANPTLETENISSIEFNGKVIQSISASNKHIYLRHSNNGGETWTDWTFKTGGGTNLEFFEVGGKLLQFTKGSGENAVWFRRSDDGENWNNWAKISDPIVGNFHLDKINDALVLSLRLNNNKIYTRHITNGINWSGWDISEVLTLEDGSQEVIDGRLVQSYTGIDNITYTRHSSDGINWTAWQTPQENLAEADWRQNNLPNLPDEFVQLNLDNKLVNFGHNLLHIYRGTDNAIWTQHSTDGETWSNSTKLTDPITGDFKVNSIGDNIVLAYRSNDQQINTRYTLDGTTWSSATQTIVPTLEDVFQEVIAGRIVQSYTGNDNHTFIRHSTDGINWTYWLPSEYVISQESWLQENIGSLPESFLKLDLSNISQIEFAGNLIETVVDSYDNIYSRHSSDAGNTWSHWKFLQGQTNDDIKFILTEDKLFHFVRSAVDNKVYVNHSNDGINWSNWTALSGAIEGEFHVNAIDNNIVLSVRGDNTQIHTRHSVDGNTWSNWNQTTIPTLTDFRQEIVNGNLVQYYLGNDHQIYARQSDDGIYWTDWSLHNEYVAEQEIIIEANAERQRILVETEVGNTIDQQVFAFIKSEIESHSNILKTLALPFLDERLGDLEEVWNNLITIQQTKQEKIANAESYNPFIHPVTGNIYFAITDKKSWKNAQAKAEELGGNLATIHSQEEQDWIHQRFNGNYWIGLTDEDQEGEWKWVTGEPFTYINWTPGSPSNSRGVEHYVDLHTGGRWNDLSNNHNGGRWGIVEININSLEKQENELIEQAKTIREEIKNYLEDLLQDSDIISIVPQQNIDTLQQYLGQYESIQSDLDADNVGSKFYQIQQQVEQLNQNLIELKDEISDADIEASQIVFGDKLVEVTTDPYQQFFVRHSTDNGNSWTTWQQINGHGDNIELKVIEDKLLLFVTGTDNRVYFRHTSNGDTWTNFTHLSDPIVDDYEIDIIDNNLVLSFRGSDNQIWTRHSSNNGINWSNWNKTVTASLENISQEVIDGRIVQSYTGVDHINYTRHSIDGINWTAWQALEENLAEADWRKDNIPSLSDEFTELNLENITQIEFADKLIQSVSGTGKKIYLRHSTDDGQTWTQWEHKTGTGSELKFAIANNKLFQFQRGTSYAIYVRHSSDGENWSGWTRLSGQYSVDGDFAVDSISNNLVLSLRDRHNQIITRYSVDGTNWSSWDKATVKTLEEVHQAIVGEQIVQSYIGIDNQIHIRHSDDGIHWTEWLQQNLSNLPNELTQIELDDVFQTEFNGKLVETVLDPNQYFYSRFSIQSETEENWTDWKKLNSRGANAQYLIAGDRLYQVYQGTDNKIYVQTTTDGENWSGITNLSGSITGNFEIDTIGDAVVLAIRGDNSKKIHTRYTTNGVNWSGWDSSNKQTIDDVSQEVVDGQLVQSYLGLDDNTYIRYSSDGIHWTPWKTSQQWQQITIYDLGKDGGIDTLEFGEGITPDALELTLENKTLNVTVSDGRNIIIQDWLNPESQIEIFRFADDTEYTPTFTFDGSVILQPLLGQSEIFPDTTQLSDTYSLSSYYLAAVDLTGDGIRLISADESLTLFDIDTDGHDEQIGWVTPTDGFLVWDANQDGGITTLNEFFSLTPQNNVTLLASLDENDDFLLDHNDSNFEKLRIWVDTNLNAKVELGELAALHRFGINSISTSGQTKNYTVAGNQIVASAYLTRLGYPIRPLSKIHDVAFAYNPDGVILEQMENGVAQFNYESKPNILFADGTATDLELIIDPTETYTATGGDGNDKLTILPGSTQGAVLNGGAGDDTLIGADGNDILTGEEGRDAINGGKGDDLITIDSQDSLSDITGGEGFDVLVIEGEGDISFVLNDLAVEVVTGNSGNNNFTAWGDEAVIISGEGGNDNIIGGNEGDRLDGGDGNDTITGGRGADILTGGTGIDIFVYKSFSDSTLTNPDTITDFEPGSDHLNFTALGYTSLNSLTITQNDETTTIASNTDNFSLILNGQLTLTADDFFFDNNSQQPQTNHIHPDFNFDGKQDLVWRNQTTGEEQVWYMDGATRTGTDSLPAVANTNWQIVGTGDANGDGKTDLYWRNQATGQNVVWYMDGVNRTGFDNLTTVANTDWEIVGIGDADEDSLIDDIYWRNQATGQNVVWYMDGTTMTSSDNLPTVTNLDWQIVGIADGNGDGKTDLYWRNQATGKNVVWYMDGANRTGFDNLPTVANIDWQIVGTGDANGDGKTDLYWRNQATGKNSVWYMDQATRTGSDSITGVPNTDWNIVG